MDGNAPCAEIIDTQHTANDIPTQIVKDEDFPYGIPILVEDRGGVGYRGLAFDLSWSGRIVVQVEDSCDRGWKGGRVTGLMKHSVRQ